MTDLNIRRRGDYMQFDAPQWLRTRFARGGAIDWFVKVNRDKLLKDGALINLGREGFVVPGAFEQSCAEIFGIQQPEK